MNKMSLSSENIFQLRQILRNFHAKKSSFIDNHRNCVQILCLVGDQNEILVRFRYYGEHNLAKLLNKKFNDDEEQAVHQSASVNVNKESSDSFSDTANWKLIVWFQKTGRVIQDLCFDPNGRHLLVVCYDNTLHIIPILWIINPEFGLKTTTSQEIENFYWPFRSDEITSFIVPFSGPHECSNSKTCPNNSNINGNYSTQNASNGHNDSDADNDDDDKYTPAQINEVVLSNNAYQSFYLQTNELKRNTESTSQTNDEQNSDGISVAEKSPDGCEKNLTNIDTTKDQVQQVIEGNCPYPLSVVWWNTSKTIEQNHQHRSIIGYSDGSICIVGIAPNCPFIANTSIDNKSGGITQMTICRDTIIKNVSLLVSSMLCCCMCDFSFILH